MTLTATITPYLAAEGRASCLGHAMCTVQVQLCQLLSCKHEVELDRSVGLDEQSCGMCAELGTLEYSTYVFRCAYVV